MASPSYVSSHSFPGIIPIFSKRPVGIFKSTQTTSLLPAADATLCELSWPLFGRTQFRFGFLWRSASAIPEVSCGIADRTDQSRKHQILVISLVLISERKHRGGRVHLGRGCVAGLKGAIALSKIEFDASISSLDLLSSIQFSEPPSWIVGLFTSQTYVANRR